MKSKKCNPPKRATATLKPFIMIEKKKSGRKKLPFAEKKKQIYILVKQKHATKAQKQINVIETQYNELS
jgi:hypothetical protein